MDSSSSKKKTTKGNKQYQEDKRAQLWRQDPEEWRSLLEEYGVQKVKTGKPEHITFCCPFHDEEQPSAAIYVRKQFFSCFGSSCPSRFIQDPFDFVARLCGLAYNDAATLFLQRFTTTGSLDKRDVQYFTEEAEKYRRMRLLSEAFHTFLCNVWADPSPEKYSETAIDAINWLRGRGITDVAPLSSLGLLPLMKDLMEILQQIGDEKDIEWCINFLGPFTNASFTHRIVFTYAKTNTAITAFKLRDFSKDHSATRLIHSEEEPLGFFGLANASYAPLLGQTDFDKALVVEGEFDQIALYQQQINAGIFDHVILGLGGSGHNGLDELVKVGVNKADLWGDDDVPGRAWPKSILEKTGKVACRIFRWPDTLKVPNAEIDPDEAIKTHGFAKVQAELADDLNYVYPQNWCHEMVVESLEGVDAEDIREQEKVVTEVATLLKNESELRAFVEKVCETYPLLETISVLKEIRKSDETDEGFIDRVVQWIQNYFHVVYSDRNRATLVLWHKERREEVVLHIGRKASLDIFGSALPKVNAVEDRSGSLMAWAKSTIGFPAHYPSLDVVDPEGKITQYSKVRDQVRDNVHDALVQVIANAPRKPIRKRGQGIHLKDIKESDVPGYVVNGDRVYKLYWNDNGDRISEATELEGPSDGHYVFDLEPRHALSYNESQNWLPCITQKEDFFRKPKRTLMQCYELVNEILNLAWQFKYQASDVQYLALLVFYTYLLDGMQKKTMTHIQGEYSSGKSSLLSLISRGDQMPEYVLSYHAITLDNYTKAGIFQTFKDTRIMMSLDEASDDNRRIATLYEAARGLAVKGFATRNIGNQDQTGQIDYIYNAWVTASATSITNDMDYSRFRTLHLVKDPARPNIQMLLRRKYTLELFEELRRDIFLNIIHHAPLIARYYYNDVREEYTKGGREHLLTREVDTLMPLAAIGKCIGMDYLQFIDTFTANRIEQQNSRTAAQEGSSLLTTILNTKIPVMTTGEREEKTIKYALGNSAYRNAINQNDCGVYYDEKERCIGVSWDTVLRNLLFQTKYRNASYTALLDLSMTCPEHIAKDDAIRSGLFQRLKSFGMAGSKHFSFFNMSDLIKEYEDAQTDTGAFDNSVESDRIKIKKDNDGNDEGEGGASLPGMNV